MPHPLLHRFIGSCIALSCLWLSACNQESSPSHSTPQLPDTQPNFLLIITDDQSWEHTGFAGYPALKTPQFDRLAQEGIYFDNAYVSAPSCTASRSALLAGQHVWRLGPAALLWGEYPVTQVNYQKILAQHGYKTGYTGKGWGPGKAVDGNPAGPPYNQIVSGAKPQFSPMDHVANFRQFLEDRQPGQAFSFWISPTEPHRPFEHGIGISSGEIDASTITVPAFLPDTPEIRSELADYLYEIQYFDRELERILQLMQEFGVLDNTVIVYTSDNGMPFARAKSNNYMHGVRVPLAIRWGDAVPEHQRVTDFISLTDLAPTFLDLAGIPVPDDMTGKSLKPLLMAGRSGRIDKQRNTVFSGFERHIVDARPADVGYPSRALHTDGYLYIRNLAPDRWPAGDPDQLADIDSGSQYKNRLLHTAAEDRSNFFWHLAAGKRPTEELYATDGENADITRNLADSPLHEEIRNRLRDRLQQEMQNTQDPWTLGRGALFNTYPYYGR